MEQQLSASGMYRLRRPPASALGLLLGGFAAIVFLVLAALLRMTPDNGEARAAARPADFPAIFARDDSLQGLPDPAAVVGTAQVTVFAPLAPFNKDTFPCVQCHDNKDLKNNPEVRKLRDPHDDMKFDHPRLWCMDCHDGNDHEKLHLANGELVGLTENEKLCAQCHGLYAREWETGVHGKRTGYWNGPKRVLRCVTCHDPHHPHFRELEPLPAPVRPAFLEPGKHPETQSSPKSEPKKTEEGKNVEKR